MVSQHPQHSEYQLFYTDICRVQIRMKRSNPMNPIDVLNVVIACLISRLCSEQTDCESMVVIEGCACSYSLYLGLNSIILTFKCIVQHLLVSVI
jgi:hypothetical protein